MVRDEELAANGKGRAAGEQEDVPLSFAGYTVEGEVGRGGMGVVYKVFDPNLRRCVALKVLLSSEHASREDIERFFREAESAGRMQHPNIVPVHELSIHEGRHYYTMDYIAGEPLDVLLEDRHLNLRSSMEVALKVARALEYAHSRGVVHRDLKPSNIIVDESGEPKITDFGLAKLMDEDGSPEARGLTRSGAIMGTPNYMAPEQAAGRSREVNPRIDVYALGCIIYEMLVGEPPFCGSDAQNTLLRHVIEMPVAPGRRGAQVPPDAETICLKCLEKEPERRYQSAGELAEDISRFLKGEPVVARRASMLYVLRRRVARHRGAVAVACLAALVMAGLGVWARYRIGREQQAGEARLRLEREAALIERQRKADKAAERGFKLVQSAVVGEEQRAANLVGAKAHFREGLSHVPGHLRCLEGITGACLAHWRILDRRWLDLRKDPGWRSDYHGERSLRARVDAAKREWQECATQLERARRAQRGSGGEPGVGTP